mmetsp:Transcript_13400/g.32749  ORF Transcript_13400/g.32749 Transcript_13400/m.32749 type:complete len:220 (+) Transcript_13400:872-1531(+)
MTCGAGILLVACGCGCEDGGCMVWASNDRRFIPSPSARGGEPPLLLLLQPSPAGSASTLALAACLVGLAGADPGRGVTSAEPAPAPDLHSPAALPAAGFRNSATSDARAARAGAAARPAYAVPFVLGPGAGTGRAAARVAGDAVGLAAAAGDASLTPPAPAAPAATGALALFSSAAALASSSWACFCSSPLGAYLARSSFCRAFSSAAFRVALSSCSLN